MPKRCSVWCISTMNLSGSEKLEEEDEDEDDDEELDEFEGADE